MPLWLTALSSENNSLSNAEKEKTQCTHCKQNHNRFLHASSWKISFENLAHRLWLLAFQLLHLIELFLTVLLHIPHNPIMHGVGEIARFDWHVLHSLPESLFALLPLHFCRWGPNLTNKLYTLMHQKWKVICEQTEVRFWWNTEIWGNLRMEI